MSTTATINHANTVAGLYEAFGKGDIPFIISHVADNCKWIGAGGDLLPHGGVYRGKEAGNFFMKLNQSLEFTSFNVDAVHNIGDKEVVAFGTMSGVSKITGKSSATDWVMHWKFNNEDKVVYYQDFYNTAAAYVANQP